MRRHVIPVGTVFVSAVLVCAIGVILLLSTVLLGCQSLDSDSTTATVETTAGTSVAPTSSSPTTGETATTSEPPTTVEPPPTTGATPTTSAAPEIVPSVPSVAYDDALLSLYRPETSTVLAGGFEQYLPLTQAPDVAIALPEDLFAGTNLLEAGVYIGVKALADLPAPWEDPYGPGEEAAGNTDFGGLTWAVFTASETAAGNIYDQRIYRTAWNGRCFEIVELLHSGQIGNYEPGTVEEFDRAQFEGYLEAIVRSLMLKE